MVQKQHGKKHTYLSTYLQLSAVVENNKMAEWQEWQEWLNGRMAEWQNGKIAEWQNGRMAEWQNVRMP
jgi:hypothetical protein